MEDLSSLAANSVWASSQHAGNTMSSMDDAMTAPGSPSEGIDQSDVHTAEQVQMPAPRPRTVVHPSAAPRIGNPWRKANGTVWEDASPDINGGNSPAANWEQS